MKNILSHYFLQYFDKDKNKWYPDIRRDWMVLFLCGFIFMIFFLFYHAYLYVQMNKEGFFSQASDTQNITRVIDANGLFAVLSDFATKKERFDSIVQKSEFIADPSAGIISSVK